MPNYIGKSDTADYHTEIEGCVIRADGTRIPLGVITSPYTDPIRNWLWKKRKERDIRRRLAR